MHKLGRNDPCHCGSGIKYKRCCLAKDEAGKVTHITSDEPTVANARSIEKLIENDLSWANHLYKLIAAHLVNKTIEVYPQDEIIMAVRLWNDYSNEEMPVTKKAGVFPAALEYIISESFGHGVSQADLARKYNVSVGTISQRVNQIFEYAERYLSPLPDRESPPPAVSFSPMGMEREMRQVSALIEEQNFNSVDEVNAFIEELKGKPSKTGLNSASKKHQAQELLFDAWDEPNIKKRIQMAKDALLLYPDSADAYNILAESASSSLKEAAYYYKQGMLAGERDLGKNFFKENKGHFWGYTPSRPYMRSKKGYAEACAEMGNTAEGIKHYRELLELNPMDNQGVRELLLVAYLEIEEWKCAAELMKSYEEDTSASFNYDRIVIEYALKGESAKLISLLNQAIKQNPHVPKYLLGKKRIPRQMPEYIGFGDDREAVVYAQTHNHIWQAQPKLLRWLGANC